MQDGMLIVCPTEFHSLCERYATSRRALGIPTVVDPFETIDQPLRNSALLSRLGLTDDDLNDPALRLKAAIARRRLGGTRFVLLVGDVDRLPVPWFEFVQGDPPSRYFYATDLYYADLWKNTAPSTLQTWDTDQDRVKGEFRRDQLVPLDWYPDVIVGRIPASSILEVTYALNRLAHVRHRPALSAQWMSGCLVLCGEDPDPGTRQWLRDRGHEVARTLQEAGTATVEVAASPIATEEETDCLFAATHSLLGRRVNLIFWFGHGAKHAWGPVGNRFFNFSNEMIKLEGAPIVFSSSCEVGAYVEGVYGKKYFSGGRLVEAPPRSSGSDTWYHEVAVPDSLQPPPSELDIDVGPEGWLTRQPAGAAALIAGHSWGTLGSDWLADQAREFARSVDSLLKRTPFPVVGAAFRDMLATYIRKYAGELPTSPEALNHLLRIHLFGDPTTPLFSSPTIEGSGAAEYDPGIRPGTRSACDIHFVETGSGHLLRLSRGRPSDHWTAEDVTRRVQRESGVTVQLSPGLACAPCRVGDEHGHDVWARTTANHLVRYRRTGERWGADVDLTAAHGVQIEGTPHAMDLGTGTLVFAAGAQSHLMAFWWRERQQSWNVIDLTATTGVVMAADAIPFALNVHGLPNVVFRASNHHLIRLHVRRDPAQAFSGTGPTWLVEDVTAATGRPGIDGDPVCCTAQGAVMVVVGNAQPTSSANLRWLVLGGIGGAPQEANPPWGQGWQEFDTSIECCGRVGALRVVGPSPEPNRPLIEKGIVALGRTREGDLVCLWRESEDRAVGGPHIDNLTPRLGLRVAGDPILVQVGFAVHAFVQNEAGSLVHLIAPVSPGQRLGKTWRLGALT